MRTYRQHCRETNDVFVFLSALFGKMMGNHEV